MHIWVVRSEMTEEQKQDWKEAMIGKYAQLVKEEASLIQEMKNNEELSKLRAERAELDDDIAERESPYIETMEDIRQSETGIKVELAEKWDISEKTFECDVGTATLRTTRSLHIRSKEKLIDFLTLNKKLVEFIKSFETAKLRKIKDAGMIEDEIATYDEKQSIAIKIVEDE